MVILLIQLDWQNFNELPFPNLLILTTKVTKGLHRVFSGLNPNKQIDNLHEK